MFISGVGTGLYLWYIWSSNMPYIGSMKDYRPPLITEVFSDSGELIGKFSVENRVVVELDQVAPCLINAFLAAEDSRFFEHQGVDITSIFRALVKNLSSGKTRQGGSTITQQVTRSLLLKNMKRTYRRKAREAILSLQLERSFSKEKILFLYLNQIYLGHGCYGVEAAAQSYFGKSAKDVSIAESAILAGLPQAPSRYSPFSNLNLAKGRQKYVLRRMVEDEYISPTQYNEAMDAPIVLSRASENPFEKAPCYSEHVRRYLLEKYGQELLYRGGLKVYTAVDLQMQTAAVAALQKGLKELDKREGYRGVLEHLEVDGIPEFIEKAAAAAAETPPAIGDVVKAVVLTVDDEKKEVCLQIGNQNCRMPLSAMEWAREPNPRIPYYSARLKKPSDALVSGDVVLVQVIREGTTPFAWEVALEQVPQVEGAIFCMAPETGKVKAMVGGRDYAASEYNRAIQSRRQPGSAFKPIIYAAALDWGMSPAEIIVDTAYVSDQNPEEEVWKPKNYKDKFFGPTLLRTALIQSRNVITVKLLKKIGVPYAMDYARKLGIESEMSPDLSLALGSSGSSLMEITRSYSVFASGGNLAKEVFIKRILDRSGQVIEENLSELKKVISEETAYVMTDLLTAVIQEGTGWRIKQLNRPAAGKTGTTNNLVDAWFVGYTPELVTGVWVGNDNQTVMGKGETGSRAASPIWLYFMRDALKDRKVVDFPVPEGVVFAKIDVKTGLLAGPHSEKTVFQAFVGGTQPQDYTPEPETPKSGQFLQYDMDFE